ncbi:LysR Transcriptional regulator [Paracoccaceae bacterium]
MLRIDAVTLRQLRALLTVNKVGSMAAAAQEIGLTAPAIHSQIKLLEDAMRTPMLMRHSDVAGSGLTDEGRVLADAMVRIEVILSHAADQISAMKAGKMGRVRLGVVSTGKYFAPRLVKMLRTLAPGIEVSLRVGNRDQVISNLDTGQVDMAIMGRPPLTPKVDALPLGPHPHGLVAAPDHPLAGRHALSAADLAEELFISREEGSGTRILMTRYLDRIGDGQVFQTVEMGSNETIKQSVMAGLGIAFLSLHTVTEELAHGRLILLHAPQLPILRHWFLVSPTRRHQSAAGAEIARNIVALNGSYLPALPPDAG